ncbi:unnamed protein product [Trichogramma brassicae]|uniref:C2H2-type domain-containing protein n=1 Tax=Trichogramma brassicae TaxID=86971 RepID=A0A6H5I7P1_9HYME|nr:unnamed protein product [Trichogramma brassicae]
MFSRSFLVFFGVVALFALAVAAVPVIDDEEEISLEIDMNELDDVESKSLLAVALKVLTAAFKWAVKHCLKEAAQTANNIGNILRPLSAVPAAHHHKREIYKSPARIERIKYVDRLRPSDRFSPAAAARTIIRGPDRRGSCEAKANKIAHSCNICGKSFSQKWYLKAHIKELHNGVTHECDICGKTYSNKVTSVKDV